MDEAASVFRGPFSLTNNNLPAVCCTQRFLQRPFENRCQTVEIVARNCRVKKSETIYTDWGKKKKLSCRGLWIWRIVEFDWIESSEKRGCSLFYLTVGREVRSWAFVSFLHAAPIKEEQIRFRKLVRKGNNWTGLFIRFRFSTLFRKQTRKKRFVHFLDNCRRKKLTHDVTGKLIIGTKLKRSVRSRAG